MSDILTLLLQITLPILGSGGLVAYAHHKMQHRIALLQQELEERKLRLEKQQADRDFGLASFREVLKTRESELEQLRAELIDCRSAEKDASELKRERDLLQYQLHAAEDVSRSWQERESKYRAAEDIIMRLELEAYQRAWKEKLIIEQITRTQERSRQLRLENRKLKQQLGIPNDETAQLGALELIGDVQEFLRNENEEDASDDL